MEYSQLPHDKISAWLGHKAIHGSMCIAVAGARQSEGERSNQEVHAQCAHGMGQDNDLHLLTHTSGIPSFTGFPDYKDFEAKTTTPEKLVEWFRNKPLEFQPGSKWKYSNLGYVLLGYLIEKVSKESYQNFLQKNILTPLGMKDTGYDSNSAIILHRASGYSPSKNGIINAGFINMTVPFSAGALYSTTEDLLKWQRGLFGGKILSSSSVKAMTTPFKENYGFGLMISTVKGHKKIEHGGGIEGFKHPSRVLARRSLVCDRLGES